MSLVVRTTLTPLGANSGKFTIQLHGVLDSWIPSLQNQGDIWQRVGQSGSGGQIVGTRGRAVPITGWRGESDSATAQTFAGNFEALELEVVQVLDAWGRAIARVRLTECKAIPRRTRGPVITGATQVLYRIDCSWQAERLPNG
jgi:hypothetical protein